MGIPKEWLKEFEDEENCRYFYIVGVRMRMNRQMEPEYNCDFVIGYNTKDIMRTELAQMMSANKLCPTSRKDAVEAVDLSNLNATLNAVSLRVRFNPEITVHKFHSDFPIEEEWFDMYIKSASVCKDVKQKLIESKMKISGGQI